MATKKTTKFDFEAALKKLETIVETMEKGGLSLEESLRFFTEGVTLTKKCQEAIKSAEQKIKILTGEHLADFNLDIDVEDDEDEDDEDETEEIGYDEDEEEEDEESDYK